MNKTLKTSVAVGLLCSGMTLGAYKLLGFDAPRVIIQEGKTPYTSLTAGAAQANGTVAAPLDFTYAAEVATPGVVHIRSTMGSQAASRGQQQVPDVFRRFFGDDFEAPRQQGPQQA